MLEKMCDLFEEKAHAKCLTTNGFVKKNGEAVMGAGVALQAKNRWPSLAYHLGESIYNYGNHVLSLGNEYDVETDHVTRWFSFPVKHHWREKADMELIKRSAFELTAKVNQFENFYDESFNTVLIPKPGCGNGGLRWEDVKEVIEPILDDRFVVIDRG